MQARIQEEQLILSGEGQANITLEIPEIQLIADETLKIRLPKHFLDAVFSKHTELMRIPVLLDDGSSHDGFKIAIHMGLHPNNMIKAPGSEKMIPRNIGFYYGLYQEIREFFEVYQNNNRELLKNYPKNATLIDDLAKGLNKAHPDFIKLQKLCKENNVRIVGYGFERLSSGVLEQKVPAPEHVVVDIPANPPEAKIITCSRVISAIGQTISFSGLIGTVMGTGCYYAVGNFLQVEGVYSVVPHFAYGSLSLVAGTMGASINSIIFHQRCLMPHERCNFVIGSVTNILAGISAAWVPAISPVIARYAPIIQSGAGLGAGLYIRYLRNIIWNERRRAENLVAAIGEPENNADNNHIQLRGN